MKTIILLTLLTSGIFSSFDGFLKLKELTMTPNKNGKVDGVFEIYFQYTNVKIEFHQEGTKNQESIFEIEDQIKFNDFNYPIYKPRLKYQDQIESESSFDEKTNTLIFSNQYNYIIAGYNIEIVNNEAEKFIDIILKPTLLTFQAVSFNPPTAEKQILL